MQRIKILNSRLSEAINKGRNPQELTRLLSPLGLSTVDIWEITRNPVKVPLYNLMPVLSRLELADEIFELSSFRFSKSEFV